MDLIAVVSGAFGAVLMWCALKNKNPLEVIQFSLQGKDPHTARPLSTVTLPGSPAATNPDGTPVAPGSPAGATGSGSGSTAGNIGGILGNGLAPLVPGGAALGQLGNLLPGAIKSPTGGGGVI